MEGFLAMNYVYLVKSKDNTKFKIGFTTNPRSRATQYRTHSLDVEYIAHIEVPEKRYETLCHWQLLKDNFMKCNVKGSTEWFDGSIDYIYFYNLVTSIKNNVDKNNIQKIPLIIRDTGVINNRRSKW